MVKQQAAIMAAAHAFFTSSRLTSCYYYDETMLASTGFAI
jgi:hypothetical protein